MRSLLTAAAMAAFSLPALSQTTMVPCGPDLPVSIDVLDEFVWPDSGRHAFLACDRNTGDGLFVIQPPGNPDAYCIVPLTVPDACLAGEGA